MAEFTFEEALGAAATPSPQTSKSFSFEDVVGSTPAPAPASQPQPSGQSFSFEDAVHTPSIIDYPKDIWNRATRDLVNTMVTSPLEGYAAKVPTDQTMLAAMERAQRGEDPFTAITNAAAENRPNLPVQQEPGYKVAKSIESGMASAFPDYKVVNPVVSDIAGGFGSVAGNIIQSMIPGLRAVAIPNIISQGAGQQVEDAIQAKATDEQIRRAARLGDISGATEFLDLLLPQLGSAGATAGLIRKVGVRALQGALIEGGQEGLQQFIQNAIAKGIYDPKRDLIGYGTDNSVLYNAMIGAIVGGGVSSVLGGHGARETSTTPTQDTINTAVAPPQPTVLNPVPIDQTQVPEVPPVGPEQTPPPTAQPTSAPQPGMPTGGEQLSLNLEPPPAPTTTEMSAKTLRPDIVQFVQNNAPPLELPKETPQFTDLINPTGGLKEEVRAAPGANTARLAKLLGPKLYGDPSNITQISVKEMFQNGFDAIKGVLEKGQMEEGNIDIQMDPKTRTIAMTDDGSGMTPQVLGKQFLEIAGTQKESKRASGGLGIAKMLFIFGNKALRVTTMRDGKVATLNTTGEQLFSALDDQSKAPNIQVRTPTAKDLLQFPKGHGTRVEVVVPEQYTDPSSGETKPIRFNPDPYFHPVLQTSPLFDNINVRLNGRDLPLGTKFPLEDYTQFANLPSEWGSARIYVTRAPNPDSVYQANVHVLSNGLWQFDAEVKADPNKPYGSNVPYQFYVDVNSKVAPEDSGYPFDLNRQDFSPQTRKVFANLFKYMSLIYQQQSLENDVTNFGSMQYLNFDTEAKSIKASPNQKIEPKSPPKETPFKLMKPGDKVTVKDGQLIVEGTPIPELTTDEITKFRINPDELRVDQSEINPNQVMLHDNIDVKVSQVETRSITEYGRERFGKRFDEFMYGVGRAFMELRDAIVKFGAQPPTNIGHPANYSTLKNSAVGISFDQEYRGVSIKIPFEGMFVNPVVTQSDNTIEAAVDVAITMVHEIAHHPETARNHELGWRGEFQRLLRVLDTTPGFSFYEFKQKLVNIYAAYDDVFKHMRGVFTSGDFSIQTRGKRFEDSSTDETRNGLSPRDTSGLGGQPERGSRLSEWVATGETIPESESRRGDPALQTSPSRSTRPSDNGRAANYNVLRSIDSGIVAAPQQPDIMPLRDGAKNILGPALPPEVKEAAAHADRINWFYKYFAGLTELLDVNQFFTPLRKYVENVRALHSDETRVHDASMRIIKDWRSLGERAKNLEAFILDVQSMPYLTPAQRKNKQWRHPTTAEFNALVAKHNIDNETLQVYNRIRSMDETFLRLIEQNAVDAAKRRIQDPVKLADAIDDIRETGRIARAQPFFPFTHFGRYYVTVKDSGGNVVHFETFEPKRIFGAQVKSAQRYQKQAEGRLKRQFPADHIVESGVLPETAGPLIGMPTLLLQQMLGEDIGLTPEQLNAIRLLQTMRVPEMRLNQRAIYKASPVPGYSLDLQRSFARYYFFGGRYYAKTRHAWALRGNISEAETHGLTSNKAGLIASYMNDHLQNTVLDARGDFGFFKGAIFLWAMGYVPAAATQNLTQTPMITLPFLAGKFGDHRAALAIVNAARKVSTYYRRGVISDNATTSFEFRALDYAVKTGRISETQAPELAGIASGNLLITGQGGTPFQRKVVAFQEKAAFMFEMAEQFNRRIVYRATLNLALKNPNAKFIKESVQKFNDEYQKLLKTNNEAEAKAIIAAIAATDQTQYVYARYARPRFMRGPLASTLFVFKRYMQSTLYMLGHNKADVLPRYMVMAMLMGGLGGVPGYDDMAGIFKAFGKWFFGKDVDIDRMVREYYLQWFGKNPTVEPDLVLHGLARRGFGIPGLVDTLGSYFTNQDGRGLTSKHSTNVPFPILDRSRALSMGNILPVDFGKISQADQDMNRTMADQTQKASGAVFSVGFNLFKALFDSHMAATDAKRWEPAMPRALASVSKSFRAFNEGRERAKGGPNSAATVVPYDVRDPEQMMEAFALAGGYQPLRVQAKWDEVMAQVEVTSFLDFKRKGLTEQYFEALKGKNPQEISEVRDAIIKFNKELPDWARGKAIGVDTLKKSIVARERALQARESGTPVQKSNIPIARHIQELFPESVVDVRRVR